MPTKTDHGVTLWAVPRFHRSEIAPVKTESGTEWVNRLKTYSFPLRAETDGTPQIVASMDPPGTCH